MRCSSFSTILAFAAAIAVVGTFEGSASAQSTGLALDRFDPAPAGDRMFGVPSPYAAGDLTPHLMLLGDYAHNPLVLRSTSSDQSLGAVVSSQLFLHLSGSLSLWNRLNVNVDVPVAGYQNGDNPNVGETFTSPSKVDAGDLRLGLRVRLFGEYFDPLQVAIGGYVWLPTGPSNAYAGTGQVHGLPQLIVGGRVDRFLWSAAVGPDIQRSSTYAGLDQGTMLTWGAGFGVLLLDNRHLQVGAETYGAITVNEIVQHTTNAELLGDIRYRVIDDFEIGVGAGPGLTTGIGTPDVRAIAMLAYTPEQKRDRDHDGVYDADDACPDVPGPKSSDSQKNGCPPQPPSDRDGDGILDSDDACPDEPGASDPDPKKNGCPKPKDRDGDGILDKDDGCPDEPGVSDPDPKKNGCPKPKDRDEDGIADFEDACPDVKGVHTSDPATNGCPPDTDGDGITDDKDACPAEKGVADPDPTKNGCPKAVRVTEKEIIILEQVQFDTGKATIKAASDSLLDQVAAAVTEHPEILRLEVQGHTDSRGSPRFNKVLSQQRADAVSKALVSRGIDPTRITAKGYGQELPIADNVSDEGRQRNRRVQFKILEKRAKENP
jgi:outer membrane protein OmpA-like peptidoglycan-associated protein